LLKGAYRSRPKDEIVAEARALGEQGVKELVLVAQDSTAYGRDRGERDGLVRLVEAILAAAPGVPWLRVMYAYPTHLDDAFLRLMASERRLLSYLDIPLQHAHPEVLRRMLRPAGDPRRLVEHVREQVPEVALRSTFIVGFPGETEEEYQSLLRFLGDAQLDRVGVFPYSQEEGASAATMAGQVPEDTKARRVEQAMLLQQGISLARNRAIVGHELDVLVEGTAPVERDGKGKRRREVLACGRSYRDAPEVDGLVLFPGKAAPGELVRVAITEALPYDLLGKATNHR
jgi:ribosomal protein S12 methylthiotransferase